MMKMGDMIERIKTLLENVPGIQYAFIYNPFRRDLEDHEPEVDVVVLGGPDLAEMDEAISKALKSPKIMLLGDEEDLRRL